MVMAPELRRLPCPKLFAVGRRLRLARPLMVAVVSAATTLACSSTTLPVALPLKPVAPVAPPKDDGKPAQGDKGAGGEAHAGALEQLRLAATGPKTDKQNSLVIPLPDAPNWTRVRFLTVPGLVGFRYGKAHHAIVAGFITHVDDNAAEGACTKSFETWAMPWVEAFEVELHHDAPMAFSWAMPPRPGPQAESAPKRVAIVDVDPVVAKTATLLSRETYAASWAAYPAWDKACLIVGVAIPSRDEDARAREVRDRFAKDVFPNVVVTSPTEPKERY